MGTSKQLISALAKSDALDRLLIISALAFFFLVVLFVIKQRVVDRGLRIALWWTRYLPDFSSGADLVRKESGGDGLSNGASSIIVVVSSAVAQTSSLSIASAHPEVQTILSESEMTLQPTEISLSHISLFSALSADPERSTPISTHDEL
jgi:protein transport protein SEC20